MIVLEELLKRIDSGNDGVIRSICIKNFNYAEIVISALDMETTKWINVRLVIESIAEFKVSQDYSISNVVISPFGIKIDKINDLYYIDLSSSYNEMEDVSDYRESDIYFAGKSLSWSLEPYSE